MASKLPDELQPASFRGVRFEVDAAELGAGRRAQVHEYPQRDKPYVEDLGRATRELAFDAFLVGADYKDQVEKLLGALETPGPGSLVHPWFGTLTVSLKDLGRIAFSRDLGYARVQLSFVESGELAFPSAGDSTTAQSRFAAEGIEVSAVEAFTENFSIADVQDFVVEAAEAGLASVMDLVAGDGIPGLDALDYAAGAADQLEDMLDMVSSPAILARSMAGFFGISAVAGSVLRWSSVVNGLLRLWQSPVLAEPSRPTIFTPSRQQVWQNTRAINALTRQLVLAQAVGGSSLMPAEVYDDTVQTRARLCSALDTECLTAPDKVYTALADARSRVWKDLGERSRNSARLATLRPPATAPALVLAYDYYEDAARDGEIVARNGIRHPGFVPAEPLRVLTK